MHAKHEHCRFGKHREDVAGGGDAAFALQSAVHKDDLRLQFAREIYRFPAATGLAHHVDVAFVLEHAAEAAANEAVVINQKHRDFLFVHYVTLGSKTNRHGSHGPSGTDYTDQALAHVFRLILHVGYGCTRHSKSDHCSAFSRLSKFKLCADQLRAFAHAHQSNAARAV